MLYECYKLADTSQMVQSWTSGYVITYTTDNEAQYEWESQTAAETFITASGQAEFVGTRPSTRPKE